MAAGYPDAGQPPAGRTSELFQHRANLHPSNAWVIRGKETESGIPPNNGAKNRPNRCKARRCQSGLHAARHELQKPPKNDHQQVHRLIRCQLPDGAFCQIQSQSKTHSQRLLGFSPLQGHRRHSSFSYRNVPKSQLTLRKTDPDATVILLLRIARTVCSLLTNHNLIRDPANCNRELKLPCGKTSSAATGSMEYLGGFCRFVPAAEPGNHPAWPQRLSKHTAIGRY